MQSEGGTKTAKYPTKLRRNYPRSRNGCLTCRQRKKKCDETRPQCTGCMRNALPCLWPTTAAQSKSAARPAVASASLSSSSSPSSSSSHPASYGSTTPRNYDDHETHISVDSGAGAEAARGHEDTLDRSNTGNALMNGHHGIGCQLLHCPKHPSNLALYQYKSRWQTYLPTLSAWQGVEGSSVNLEPAYDDDGRRTRAVLRESTSGEQPPNADEPMVDADDVDDNGDNDEANGDGSDYGDDDAAVAAWSSALASFVTVAKSPSPACPSGRRVAALTPLSASLLRHFIVETAPSLSTARAARNPFLAAVLPLAYTDDLVMHCVVAIGGAHLSNRLTCGQNAAAAVASSSGSSGSSGSAPECECAGSATSLSLRTPADAAAAALHAAVTRHYTSVLRSLRGALRDLRPGDAPQVLRVLLVLMLLAMYECLSWNVLGGGVFAHLGASRQLIAWLRGSHHHHAEQNKLTADERSLLGALMEMYAYTVLVNRICPDGSVAGRLVVAGMEGNAGSSSTTTTNQQGAAADDDDNDDEDFVADPGSLAAYPEFFGFLFSGLHGLFALIPPVTRLAGQAQRQNREGGGRGETAASVARQVAALRTQVLAWQLPAGPSGAGAGPAVAAAGDQERIWQRAIGEVYRHGLLVYLETIGDVAAAAGEDGGNNNKHSPMPIPSAAAAAATQRHVHTISVTVLGSDLVASRFATILLWPVLVAGTVLVQPHARTFLAEGLRTTPQATWASTYSAAMLERLWRRRDAALAAAEAEAGARNSASSSTASSTSSSAAYYGPQGFAQIMKESNVSLCVG